MGELGSCSGYHGGPWGDHPREDGRCSRNPSEVAGLSHEPVPQGNALAPGSGGRGQSWFGVQLQGGAPAIWSASCLLPALASAFCVGRGLRTPRRPEAGTATRFLGTENAPSFSPGCTCNHRPALSRAAGTSTEGQAWDPGHRCRTDAHPPCQLLAQSLGPVFVTGSWGDLRTQGLAVCCWGGV